jgi:PKD repeat protein
MTTPRFHRVRTRQRSRGQSIVEFALLFPVVMLILMVGLDFGRIYLGWINLNNTARIAANFAATNAIALSGSGPSHDNAVIRYRQLIANDAQAINCELNPNPVPDPSASLAVLYPGGTDVGQTAHVGIVCDFAVITPVISTILGTTVTVSAAADFPIRQGIIAGGGGGPPAVQALFNASPLSGDAPLTVTFTDLSTGSPTSYAWDFQNDGIIDSTSPTGNTFTYTIPGTYTVKLTVSNGLSTDSETHDIAVTAPPGPIANFDAAPLTGTAPLTVNFTDTSTGSKPLTYLWDFGNGNTSTAKNPPNQTYAAGNWTVTLVVTDSAGLVSAPASRLITVAPAIPQCTVPNYKGQMTSNQMQVDWTTAGFSTAVIFNPLRPPEFRVKTQSLKAGSSAPCGSAVITLTD